MLCTSARVSIAHTSSTRAFLIVYGAYVFDPFSNDNIDLRQEPI